MTAADLSVRRFRLNPAFKLLAPAELSEAERRTLGDLREEAGVHAVLIPRVPDLTAKAIDLDTATFLASLKGPKRLSSETWTALAGDLRPLRRLVLDAVLELEDEGCFVSGPRASAALGVEEAPGVDESATAVASSAALVYAAALGLRDPQTLSARLYMYGREPVSPAWRRMVDASAGFERWLGLDRGGHVARAAAGSWGAPRQHAANPNWIYFQRPDAQNRRLKMYVAPTPALLPEVLPVVIRTFARHGVGAFKIGRTLATVLRPDKVVAYVESHEQIEAIAIELGTRLAGLRSQPVPFTASLDPDGLASWGVDPPPEERVSAGQGISWRRWITDHLAVALVAGCAAGVDSPASFALQRLALEGINTRTWAPAGLHWAPESPP